MLVQVKGRPVGPGNCAQVHRRGGMSPAFCLIYPVAFLKHAALMGCKALGLNSPPDLFPSWPWTNANIGPSFSPGAVVTSLKAEGGQQHGVSLQHPDCEQVTSQAFVETQTLLVLFFLLSLGETARAPWECAFQTKLCHLYLSFWV